MTMNDILAVAGPKLEAIENEINWTKKQLKDVPFTAMDLKIILKAHIEFLQELQMKEMSKTITALYRQEKAKETEFLMKGIKEDLS